MIEAKSIIGGIFPTLDDAQQAVRELRSAGFTENQIGLISRREDGSLERERGEKPGHWEEGTGIGAAVGATAGTGLGLAVVAGLLTPVGPVIAGGMLVGLLVSLGVGATVGSAIGGLVGLGMAQDDAEYFEEQLKSGKSLVTVTGADSDLERAIEVIQRIGGKLRL